MIDHVAPLPLTAAQTGIWYAQLLDPLNPTLNVGHYVEIVGPLDVVAFRAAHCQAVRECGQLNICVVETAEGPRQRLLPEPMDLDVVRPGGKDAALSWMHHDLSTPIDVTKDQVRRSALLRVAPDTVLWYQRYHQIALDGFGWALLARRVATLYNGLDSGLDGGSPLRPLPPLLDEELASRASDEYAADRDYWLRRLDGAALTGPSAPVSRTFGRRTVHLAPEARDALTMLAARLRIRWTRVLVALVAAYVHRLTGADDVVLSIPVTGRVTQVARTTPSRMSNTLPLRLSIPAGTNLAELAHQVSTELHDLLAHQRYRGEELRRDLGGTLDGPRYFGPVVNVMRLDYGVRFGQCTSTFAHLATGPVDGLSFTFLYRRGDSSLRMDVDTNPAAYDGNDLDLHRHGLHQLMERVPTIDPDRPVDTLDVLGGTVAAGCEPRPEPVSTNGETAPRTPLEVILARIWCDVLGIERVGIRDSFAGLGGNSLHLAAIGAAIRRTLRIDFPLRMLFEATTVAELADALTNSSANGNDHQVERAADVVIGVLRMEGATL